MGPATYTLLEVPKGLGNRWRLDHAPELHLSTVSRYFGIATLHLPNGVSLNFQLNTTTGVMEPMWDYYSQQKNYKLEYVGTWPVHPTTGLIYTWDFIYNVPNTQWRLTDPDNRVWIFQTVSVRNLPTSRDFRTPSRNGTAIPRRTLTAR